MYTLQLPESLEEIKEALKKANIDKSKISDFFEPVKKAEEELAVCVDSILRASGQSGKILIVWGQTGSGKSTFFESLTWNPSIPIEKLSPIQTNSLGFGSDLLENLYLRIVEESRSAHTSKERGKIKTLVIEGLEDPRFIQAQQKKAFFQRINGFLRQTPVLILWPMTEKASAEATLEDAEAVSDTIFARRPLLHFTGPDVEKYPSLGYNTILTLYPGSTLEDFSLTYEELEHEKKELQQKAQNPTPRKYLRRLDELWQRKNDHIEKLRAQLPRPTQIWFVFCHPTAETDIAPFARKQAQQIEQAWDAYFDKLNEYIIKNKNNQVTWPNINRLQLALRGCFQTKILHLPTHVVISSILAFGTEEKTLQPLHKDFEGYDAHPESWSSPRRASEMMSNAALFRQLAEQESVPGETRGGPVKSALEKASGPYKELNTFVSGKGSGSDQPINQCIAKNLRRTLETFGTHEAEIHAETEHPFLPGIRPDIQVDDKNSIIALEFHYALQPRPSDIANYILRKLDKYMKVIENPPGS